MEMKINGKKFMETREKVRHIHLWNFSF